MRWCMGPNPVGVLIKFHNLATYFPLFSCSYMFRLGRERCELPSGTQFAEEIRFLAVLNFLNPGQMSGQFPRL